MKLRVIIVDDEEGAQLVLENYIARISSLSLTGVFTNALEAFTYMKQHSVDVIFLDINMPEIDGFGLLDILSHRPGVIFTTAYSDFALKGFEYNAIDYLKKPIRFERFVTAVDKAEKWSTLQSKIPVAEIIEFKIDGVQVNLKLCDMYYAEGLGNYIKLHMRDKSYMLLMTMHNMEKLLPPSLFIRIHKSYIVNTQNITRVAGDKVFVNAKFLPIGKTYKKYFLEYWKLIDP